MVLSLMDVSLPISSLLLSPFRWLMLLNLIEDLLRE